MMQPKLIVAALSVACAVLTSDCLAQSKCQIKRDAFVNGGTANVTASTEKETACQFKFRFQNINPPDSWQLVEPPKSGKVTFAEDAAEYQPNAGFVGDDQFVVAIFGRVPNCSHQCNRNGKFAFNVSVKP